MSFRELCAGTDQDVLDACGDEALIDGRIVQILFAEPWIEPRVGTLRTDITQPMAYLPVSSLSSAGQGSILVFSAREYDVVGVEPDGTGWVGLVLRER